jgi:cell division protein FtsX
VISFVVFSIRRAWQGFWRNAVMSLAAPATMVLMLLLLAGFWIIQTGLLAGLQFTEQKVEVVADLQDNVIDSQVTDLRTRVAALPEVATVTYISREQALEDFRARLQEQGQEDLTRYLDSNPLRIIALFIIVNTIRLAVVARAEEIEIMRLVGASDAFIRWPFVFEGAFVGLAGSLITLGVLAAVADPVSAFMVDFFRVLPLQFGSLSRDLIVLILGAGVGLGVLGSWVSVRTYLIR